MNLQKPIQVIDEEGQELFGCSLEEREKAFQFARQMEAIGVAVNIREPNSVETLGMSLGFNDGEEAKKLQEDLRDEIEGHNA